MNQEHIMASRRYTALLFLLPLLLFLLVPTLPYTASAQRAPDVNNDELQSASNLGKVSLVGHYTATQKILAVTIQGDYAYAIGEGEQDAMGRYVGGGFYVLDVSDPFEPKQAAYVPVEGYIYPRADIMVVDHLAYTLIQGVLRVFDVSIPSEPRRTGYYEPHHDSYHIAVAGNYAYLAGTNGFDVLNIENTLMPTYVGGYSAQGEAKDITVSRHYVYLLMERSYSATYERSHHIVDVSTPASPNVVYEVTGSSLKGHLFYRQAVKGNTLYQAIGEELYVYNISNPSTPQFKGKYLGLEQAADIAVAGNYAYIADWGGWNGTRTAESGLRVLDVSNPTEMTELAFYVTPGVSHRVVVDDNLIYLASRNDGLYILRFSPHVLHLPFIHQRPSPTPP
jgi:hypothetical protein